MSQVAKLFSGSPAGDIEFLTGNSGGPVGADAGLNINIVGGIGILVTGNPATHTLTITDDDLVQGDVTTLNAVPTTCITFPMGAVPGAYVITGRLAAYNVTDVAGGGYSFSGAYRTTGVAGTEIASQSGFIFEEAAMVAAGFDLFSTGNNIILQVTGIALKTINWSGEFEYQFVG
jgi:hypothetical protein